jgi:RNA polymerase sigma-54 factor
VASSTRAVPAGRDCFDELIAHRWSEISKRFGIAPSDVQRAADEIAKLDPKRASLLVGTDNYIIPDLIVDKIDQRYHVFLNDANLPRSSCRRRTRRSRATRRSSTGRARSSSPRSSTPRTG